VPHCTSDTLTHNHTPSAPHGASTHTHARRSPPARATRCCCALCAPPVVAAPRTSGRRGEGRSDTPTLHTREQTNHTTNPTLAQRRHSHPPPRGSPLHHGREPRWSPRGELAQRAPGLPAGHPEEPRAGVAVAVGQRTSPGGCASASPLGVTSKAL
jgi:hypothetical protein